MTPPRRRPRGWAHSSAPASGRSALTTTPHTRLPKSRPNHQKNGPAPLWMTPSVDRQLPRPAETANPQVTAVQFNDVQRTSTQLDAGEALQVCSRPTGSMSRTERPGSAGRKLWGHADSRMTRRAISSTCWTVSTAPVTASGGLPKQTSDQRRRREPVLELPAAFEQDRTLRLMRSDRLTSNAAAAAPPLPVRPLRPLPRRTRPAPRTLRPQSPRPGHPAMAGLGRLVHSHPCPS